MKIHDSPIPKIRSWARRSSELMDASSSEEPNKEPFTITSLNQCKTLRKVLELMKLYNKQAIVENQKQIFSTSCSNSPCFIGKKQFADSDENKCPYWRYRFAWIPIRSTLSPAVTKTEGFNLRKATTGSNPKSNGPDPSHRKRRSSSLTCRKLHFLHKCYAASNPLAQCHTFTVQSNYFNKHIFFYLDSY